MYSEESPSKRAKLAKKVDKLLSTAGADDGLIHDLERVVKKYSK